jgi:hypothetical protein
MRIPHLSHRFVRPVALAASMAILGATALPSHAARAPASWRQLFPPATAYPRGTHLLPVHTATRANVLVNPATAPQVAHLGFIVGGIQYANLPGHTVASVTVLVFRMAAGAATFVRADRPAELKDPQTPGVRVGGLGNGARYVSGACAPCGPSAAPVGILLVQRGTVVVQILTQPANRALALWLGHAAVHR